ncbi:hypothetical protein PYTT13_07760 [Paracoccus yeei]|uniref:SnoaL-like domain-containing protein n=1 Tax=Paracoccus yeei TaxID=147645 RepID=A0A2D2BZP9_9RHOB|nr:hypothetical protein PYTT13_07760 [Paracoccus yeei]
MRGRTKAGSFHDRDPTNTAIVISFYEAFARTDLDAFDGILAPDCINPPADPGRASSERLSQGPWPGAFPRGSTGGAQAFSRLTEAESQDHD